MNPTFLQLEQLPLPLRYLLEGFLYGKESLVVCFQIISSDLDISREEPRDELHHIDESGVDEEGNPRISDSNPICIGREHTRSYREDIWS